MLVLNSLFAQLSRHYWLLTVFIAVINLAFSVMCKGYVSSRATRLCQFCVSSFCTSFISKLCFICHVLCTLQHSQQSILVNQGSRHTFQGCNSVCRLYLWFWMLKIKWNTVCKIWPDCANDWQFKHMLIYATVPCKESCSSKRWRFVIIIVGIVTCAHQCCTFSSTCCAW